jgi:hypothetical protein
MARPTTALRSIAVAALVSVLSSCFTGERPSVSEAVNAPGTETGDVAIDAVLERLDQASSATFTAGYEILTRYGNRTSQAEVVQAAPNRKAITIGDVEFVIDGDRSETCRTDRDRCVEEVDDSFVSDLQVTHRFYAEAAATRLRQAARDRTGDATGSTEKIAGRKARCVTVDVTGGAKRFCALSSGALALLDDASVQITLTVYTNNVDVRSID